jgi:hypothetical protein
MWSQEAREAYRLFMAILESKLIQLHDVVEEYIAEYYSFILIGSAILIVVVILRLVRKWQDKREKQRIDKRIEEQMKEKVVKGTDDNSGVRP